MASSRLSRIGRSALRWLVIGVVSLLLLEGMCHLVTLSNDSLPIDYMADPWMAYRMMPGSHGTSALGVPYQINAVGLRNPEIQVPKPPGVFRVLTIGDSVTLGYGVPSEVTFTRVLEKKLEGQKIEFINAGASGFVAKDQVAFLEHYGLALEPDLIIQGFTRGDMGEPLKLQIRDGVGYDSTNVGFIPPFVKKALRHSRLYLAIGRAWGTLHEKPPVADDVAAREASFQKQWDNAHPTLERLATIGREHHIPVLIAYLPVSIEVQRGAEYPSLLAKLESLGGAGYHFVNVLPAFGAEPNRAGLYLPLDPAHPTALGHSIVAASIYGDPFFRSALPPGTKFN